MMNHTYDKIIDEYEYDWTAYIDSPICFNKEYLKGRNIEDFYVDQAPRYNRIYDRSISSFYLKTGLNRMESWVIKQINKSSKYSKEELNEMIKRNPHLHNIIKTNLMENLNNKPL